MKITYFDILGLAETSRLLCIAAGQEFDQKRFQLFDKDGKFSNEDWKAEKKSGTYPFETLPLLNVGDDALPQSRAIENFLSRKFGFHGKGDVQGALIEAVPEQLKDIGQAFRKVKDGSAEEKQKWWAEEFPHHLDLLDRFAEKHGEEGHFVGGKLSLADIAFFNYLTGGLQDFQTEVNSALGSRKHLLAIKEQVAKQEKIAAYIATRPKFKM